MNKTIRMLMLLAALTTGGGMAWAETINGVTYIDADGSSKTADNVTVLTSSTVATTLGTDGQETWYVVSADVSYRAGITLKGDVHIIIEDDKTMTVTGGEYDGMRVFNYPSSLSLYGQTEGTGFLDVAGINGIYSDNTVTINGVKVKATGETPENVVNDYNYGIYACYGLTINGGKVETTGKTYGIYAEYNLITINGGKVEATGETYGIYTELGSTIINGGQVKASSSNIGIMGDIQLRWTKSTDYLQASTYDGNLTIADGQYFTFDGLLTIKDDLPERVSIPLRGLIYSDIINRRTFADGSYGVIPPDAKLVPTLPVYGGYPYALLWCPAGTWELPDGVMAFVPTDYSLTDGTITLNEVGKESNKFYVSEGRYYILGNTNEGQKLDDLIMLIGTSTTGSYTTSGTHFVTTDGHKTLDDLVVEALGTGMTAYDAIIYTLVAGDFRPINVDYTGSGKIKPTSILDAGQMLFIVSKWEMIQALRGGDSGNNSARKRTIGIDIDGVSTGLSGYFLTDKEQTTNDNWYSLDGRKLDKVPTAKGVYIHNGIKHVVR